MNLFCSLQLFLLGIISIISFLSPLLNCYPYGNDDIYQVETVLYPKSSLITSRFHDLLEPNIVYYNDDDDDDYDDDDRELKIFSRDLLRSYPDRRSFHAMRGK